MRQLISASLLVLLLYHLAAAQVPVNVEVVRKSVVFLFASDQQGNVNKAAPLATAFLIQVPLKGDPSHAYQLLVTARHVVDPVWAFCPPHRNPSRVFVRLNRKNFDPAADAEGVTYLPLNLIPSGKNKNTFTSLDESVDAAVVLLGGSFINPAEFDFVNVALSNFATPEEIKGLTEGVEIVSAGVVPTFPGNRRNYPIFKFGRIAAIPQERIQVPCAAGEPPNLLRLWLMAVNLVPGNSGSPVVSFPRWFSAARPALVGLQSMSFPGSDVAGITPSQYIYEIIEGMGLPDANLYRGPAEEPKKPTPQTPK